MKRIRFLSNLWSFCRNEFAHFDEDSCRWRSRKKDFRWWMLLISFTKNHTLVMADYGHFDIVDEIIEADDLVRWRCRIAWWIENDPRFNVHSSMFNHHRVRRRRRREKKSMMILLWFGSILLVVFEIDRIDGDAILLFFFFESFFFS